MRIALTNPYCWPQIRRGSERLLHDLAAYLTRRGHDVTVITSVPPGVDPEFPAGIETVAWQQRWQRLHAARGAVPGLAFALHCRRAVRDGGFDVVHSLHHFDAFGAALAKRVTEKPPRLIHQFMGIPVRRYFLFMPHELLMFRYVLGHADAILVLSTFARDALARDFSTPATIVPLPVDTGPFRRIPKQTSKTGWPTFLFLGDTAEPRKGALPCARAFDVVREAFPNAALEFCGNAPDRVRGAILAAVSPAAGAAIRFLGAIPASELPSRLAAATVMVLPAMWEAFGVVFAEALASGTPVVGCRHGGISDIVDDPDIGVLVDPGDARGVLSDVPALAKALREAVALAGLPETEKRCRRHAERFSWDGIGPSYEALYDNLLAGD